MGFELGHRHIGDGAPVFVIAELSANHGGNLSTALRTIEAAAKTGVDAIKLQTYTPDTLTLNSRAPDFVVKTSNQWAGRTLHDLYAEAMTPWEWHAELFACAKACGLLCFSTPFDVTAVELLEQLGAPCHKVASFELVDLPLVERIARTQKPMIMSTGMASLGEIEAAVRVCKQAGNHKLALLRCVSAYPAAPEDMQLKSIDVLASFGVVVGLSDHTLDNTAAIVAVARGACIIEKHFILDRAVGGPDSFFSLEPSEMASLVKSAREAQRALGGISFGPSVSERASLAFRRSLYVAKDVARGEVLTCDHVRSVRPAHGLPASALPQVLGRTAHADLTAGKPLAWADVGSAPASDDTLVLRRATLEDSALLLSWRNDELTRQMSVSKHEVKAEEHRRWLEASLANSSRALFVALEGALPVGTLRLDYQHQEAAEVSLTLAPEARGRGLAAPLLRLLEREAAQLGVLTLVAQILPENQRSAQAFKRAGYYGFAERQSEVPALWCERRIVAYA
ncbi:MAG: pseudaminic acid synthase [Myxococcales bacterium]